MFGENLYENTLIDPAKYSKHLYIVSGYATPAMAFRHLSDLQKINQNINVHLIVGMTSSDGISYSNHHAFKKLVCENFSNTFTCSYVYKKPPVHSKLYIWSDGSSPNMAFIGSANYTQNAFIINKNREILSSCDALLAYKYYNQIVNDTLYCQHPDVEGELIVYNELRNLKNSQNINTMVRQDDGTHVKISLLDRYGSLPAKSGLNWGQREGREPNQAYIKVPIEISKRKFFPSRKIHFTLITDDKKTLICTIAQEGDKAIETPHNNSLIGEYFRNRLGLRNGQFIEKADLLKYGRTDIDFYRVDDETYYMDFSV